MTDSLVLVATRGNFIDLFLLACFVFYVCSRLARQDWGSLDANSVRKTITSILLVFASLLLLASIFKIPGCERRDQPAVQQDKLPNPPVKSPSQPDMPNDKK